MIVIRHSYEYDCDKGILMNMKFMISTLSSHTLIGYMKIKIFIYNSNKVNRSDLTCAFERILEITTTMMMMIVKLKIQVIATRSLSFASTGSTYAAA